MASRIALLSLFMLGLMSMPSQSARMKNVDHEQVTDESSGEKEKTDERQPWISPDGQPAADERQPWVYRLPKLSLNSSHMIRPFECASSSVDNFAPPTDDRCYIRMYWCSSWFGIYHNADPTNHNAADVMWAVRDAAHSCGSYGGYLHVYRVEVARPSIIYGRGRYSQCNNQDCIHVGEVDDDDPTPQPKTWFGWNPKEILGLPRREIVNFARWYSLPDAAKGPVDATQAYDLLQHGFSTGLEHGHFQWNPVCQESIIDRNKCLKSLGLDAESKDQSSATTEEDIASFAKAAFGGSQGRATDACKDVTWQPAARVPLCP